MTVQCTLSFIHYTALYYRPIECFIQPTGLCGGVFFKPAIISEYNVYMAPSNCPQIVHCSFFQLAVHQTKELLMNILLQFIDRFDGVSQYIMIVHHQSKCCNFVFLAVYIRPLFKVKKNMYDGNLLEMLSILYNNYRYQNVVASTSN